MLTPFTLRFVKDAEGARFDACAADSEAASAAILKAALAAGAPEGFDMVFPFGISSRREAYACGVAVSKASLFAGYAFDA